MSILAWGWLGLALAAQPEAPPPAVIQDIQQIAASGRCASLPGKPDDRVAPPLMIAPGPPPLLSFRYYEGKLHHRVGNGDLMLDDAGH